MKARTLLAVAVLAVAACTSKPGETTTLIGQFDNKLPDEVHILAGDIDTLVATDPATHSFRVELPTDVLSMASIDSEDHGAMVILDGTTLTVKFGDEGQVDITSDKPKASVQTRYNAFGEWMRSFMEKYQEDNGAIMLDDELSDAEKETKQGELYEKASENLKKKCLSVIKDNSDNIIALVALSSIQADDDEMTAILDGFSPALKETESVQAMVKALDVRAESGEGKPFKDFTVVQDPDNAEATTVKLSDYVGQGKYILVDFWASWCGPCRAEMPNLKAVYEKYHGDDFDMLSVAVWDNPEATRAAAEELGISWNQIVNAQQIPTELYGIEGIPHIILFGPDGTVLKRNLRGEAIGEALDEYLK